MPEKIAEKKYFTPDEAVKYLNENLKPEKALDVVRLAHLRREKRIYGEQMGKSNIYLYTRKALDMVTLSDIRDKRKNHASTY